MPAQSASPATLSPLEPTLHWGELCIPFRQLAPGLLEKVQSLITKLGMQKIQAIRFFDAEDHAFLVETTDGKDAGCVSPLPEGISQDAQEIKKILELHLFDKGKARLSAKESELSARPATKISQAALKYVVPFSDVFAVLRNGLGLTIALLLIAGCTPLSPLVLTLFSLFAVALIVQGTLFALPQGILGWGVKGANTYELASHIGDEKHKLTGILKGLSGFLSVVEGVTWVVAGVLLAAGIIPGFTPFLTIFLFYVIFNVSFCYTVATGARDYLRHSHFRNKLLELTQNQKGGKEEYGQVLNFLRKKLVLDLSSTKPEEKGKKSYLKRTQEELIQKAARKLYRFKENGGAVDELTEIERLMENLKTQQGERSLLEAQAFVEKVLNQNQTLRVLDSLSIVLGAVGAVVGTFLSIGIGAVAGELWGAVSDWILWMALNAVFLCLDVDALGDKTGSLFHTAKFQEKLQEELKAYAIWNNPPLSPSCCS